MRRSKILIASMLLFIFVFAGILINISPRELKIESNPKVFGATYMTMNNPYFVVLNNSIKEVVEGNGDILISRDPSQDQLKQNQQILDMIEEGVDAIFLNPVDWKTVKPALVACYEANIPVFNIDTYVYDDEYVVSTIISDNYNAGVQCAEDVLKKKAKSNIIVLNHPEMNSIIDRVRGFTDVIKGHEDHNIIYIESAGAELEVAMNVMNDIIEFNWEFDVIFGGNDPSALGALAALQLNNYSKDVLIYGVDGSPDGKTMIKENHIEGSSAQRPIVIGRTAAETAYQYFAGASVDRSIIIPVSLITKENINEFDIAGWQ